MCSWKCVEDDCVQKPKILSKFSRTSIMEEVGRESAFLLSSEFQKGENSCPQNQTSSKECLAGNTDVTMESCQTEVQQNKHEASEDSDVPEEFRATLNRNQKKPGAVEQWLAESTSDKENEERNSSPVCLSFQAEQVQMTETEEPAQSNEDSDVPEEFKATFKRNRTPALRNEDNCFSDEEETLPKRKKNNNKKNESSDEDWSPASITEDLSPVSDPGSDEEEELSDSKASHDERKHLELCTECGAFTVCSESHTCNHKKRPHACSVCGRRFATERYLKGHIKSHSENPDHFCVYCFATIITPQDKLDHQRIHQEQSQPYQCRHCTSAFSSLSERDKHIRSHRGPLQHKCDICGLSFRTKCSHDRHVMIHTGRKPFQCSVCERGFNQEGHLKSHMRLHTGERPYVCPHCDKAYNHNVSLKSHIQRYHPSESADRQNNSCEEAVKKEGDCETGPGSEQTQQETFRKPKKKVRGTGRPRGRPKSATGGKKGIKGSRKKTRIMEGETDS